MRCAVGFSLWGDNPIYTIGALKQLDLYNAWSAEGPYDWTCYFYVGSSVPNEIVDKLVANGGLVYSMTKDWPENQTATFWRFLLFNNLDFDAIFMRDTDSRLSEREKLAVTEFLESKKGFHIIRDHPFHGVPILAGLFGAKQHLFRDLAERLPGVPGKYFYLEANRWKKGNYHSSNDFYQVDQIWLRLNVYPYIRTESFSHDCYFGFDRKRDRIYLPEREPGDFIGKGFDENDLPRHPEHDELLDEWPRKFR